MTRVPRNVVALLLALLLPTSAMAGQGWYLLTPPQRLSPIETKVGDVDVAAPVYKWKQEQAFDTAQECERERIAARVKAATALRGFQQGNTNLVYKMQTLANLADLSAVCIATDDPRLKP